MSRLKDNQIIGIIAGLLLPLLITILIYNLRYFGGRTYFDFIETLITFHSFGKLLSLSVLPNLLLFFICIWSNWLRMARGVLIATVIYGIATIILALLG